MANRHFGKFADVWKHLPLAEVLTQEKPARYSETHAGSAVYPMVDDAERRFGVLHFVDAARDHQELGRSRYLELISPFLKAPAPVYPGSATIAMSALGTGTSYLFCDLDGASVADLRDWAQRLGADVTEVAQADGMATTARWLADDDRAHTVVHVDPFDPHAKGSAGKSALEFAADVVEQGYVLVYWYGYDEPEQSAWAYHTLGELTGRPLWCGDMMIVDGLGSGTGGDLGAASTAGTGCGVVLGNVTADAAAACDRLGRAVARGYREVTLPCGQPGGVRFTTEGSM